ncbi:MAG: tRNA pseudouridine(55) synthase TruB [Bacillota bacterium]|nr:tRNA pseudouridine(55) synthase TruB [Bacillota bacterium]
MDKPREWTSFDVVARIRGLTGVRKVGHAGTLDPFADGLLPVCIGRATRVIRFMETHDKTYRVTVAFGTATDTQDLTGQTIFERHLTDAEKIHLVQSDFCDLRQAVSDLTRLKSQLPPMYSAVKIQGRPLYQYARKGQSVERTERPIRIYESVLESVTLEETLTAVIRIHCSKGTYIRSLCDTLGHRLGWGAHAAALRRLTCGPWSVDQAVTVESLSRILSDCPDRVQRLQILSETKILMPAETALVDLPVLQLKQQSAIDLINGRVVLLEPGQQAFADRFAVYYAGQLIAVAITEQYNEDAWRIRTERVLIDLADLLRS